MSQYKPHDISRGSPYDTPRDTPRSDYQDSATVTLRGKKMETQGGGPVESLLLENVTPEGSTVYERINTETTVSKWDYYHYRQK